MSKSNPYLDMQQRGEGLGRLESNQQPLPSLCPHQSGKTRLFIGLKAAKSRLRPPKPSRIWPSKRSPSAYCRRLAGDATGAS